MFNCTPKKTVTFNYDGWGNEMTYEKGTIYQYAIVFGRYEVHFGSGYLYFDKDEFFKYFGQVA